MKIYHSTEWLQEREARHERQKANKTRFEMFWRNPEAWAAYRGAVLDELTATDSMDDPRWIPPEKSQTIPIGDLNTPMDDIYAQIRAHYYPERTDWRAMPAYKPAVGRGLSRAQVDFERAGQEWKARR